MEGLEYKARLMPLVLEGPVQADRQAQDILLVVVAEGHPLLLRLEAVDMEVAGLVEQQALMELEWLVELIQEVAAVAEAMQVVQAELAQQAAPVS